MARSNGPEKDKPWAGKGGQAGGRGAHAKTCPKRDLRDVEATPEGLKS